MICKSIEEKNGEEAVHSILWFFDKKLLKKVPLSRDDEWSKLDLNLINLVLEFLRSLVCTCSLTQHLEQM